MVGSSPELHFQVPSNGKNVQVGERQTGEVSSLLGELRDLCETDAARVSKLQVIWKHLHSLPCLFIPDLRDNILQGDQSSCKLPQGRILDEPS